VQPVIDRYLLGGFDDAPKKVTVSRQGGEYVSPITVTWGLTVVHPLTLQSSRVDSRGVPP